MSPSGIGSTLYELFAIYGIKIVAAIAIFLIGRLLAKVVKNALVKLMQKNAVDETLTAFVGNLAHIALIAFVIIAAISQLGIQTTSFIAVLGAAGLAIGLALQGSLSNFAAGVLMIVFRPFKTGDFIEGGGAVGTVEEIQIFTTQIKTGDNKTVIVPNSKMMGDNIVNYSTKGTRRVDLVFGIGYEDDIDHAKRLISEIFSEDGRIMQEPAPMVALSELADSSVNFVARAWTSADDYWNVYFDTQEKVKKRFDKEGISIPYPQRDIHVFEHKE